MAFSKFGFDPTLLAAIAEEGYSAPTPIQTEAIPVVMEGRDLFGLAQTGTGKTAAFALPILNRYFRDKKLYPHHGKGRRGPRCLVLTPTRELAMQVAESFTAYGRRTHLGVAVVFGGVGIAPQKEALRRRPEILVATPGRLLDLMGQGEVDLSQVDVFILDEADRMFDMGFIHDIRKVVARLPTERQTLLFSATMPDEIAELAKSILRSPARVEVTPAFRTADTVSQFVYFVGAKERITLMRHLLVERDVKRCIVFTRMKHVANRVAETLRKEGIAAEAFHANKSQSARVRALTGFKRGEVRVLVATDIAARGLDVDDVEVVINYDLPEVPETYVHRIGRAGRAGKTGTAWSLCPPDQRELLEDIERVTKVVPEIVAEHPLVDVMAQGCLDAHQSFRARKDNARTPQRTSSPQRKPASSKPQAGKSAEGARPPRQPSPRPQHSSAKPASEKRPVKHTASEKPAHEKAPARTERRTESSRPQHRPQRASGKPEGEQAPQRRTDPSPQKQGGQLSRGVSPASPKSAITASSSTAADPKGIRGLLAKFGFSKRKSSEDNEG